MTHPAYEAIEAAQGWLDEAGRRLSADPIAAPPVVAAEPEPEPVDVAPVQWTPAGADPFEHLIGGVLGREGGYANHPDDRGGETMWGITIGVARRNGYAGAMRAMPRAEAVRIYRAEYWERPGFVGVATLSVPLAEELFDTGINMGQSVASTFLQQALNALNRQGKDFADLKVDGDVGRATITALTAYLRLRKAEGELVLLKALNVLQGARYIALAESRAANESFAYGWLRTRVELPR